jgi:hypothetical protein
MHWLKEFSCFFLLRTLPLLLNQVSADTTVGMVANEPPLFSSCDLVSDSQSVCVTGTRTHLQLRQRTCWST